MAGKLNKTRMRDTRILMILCVLLGMTSETLFTPESIGYFVMHSVGFILVLVCCVGRIYSSAFIGGVKNEKLITVGPYSVVRNPLYFFSLCGAVGIGFLTTSFLCILILFTGFYFIYNQLIQREEAFLLEKFGAAYQDYCNKVHRLLPSFCAYILPAEMIFQPKYLNNAVADAIWWVLPIPLFILLEDLRSEGLFIPFLKIF